MVTIDEKVALNVKTGTEETVNGKTKPGEKVVPDGETMTDEKVVLDGETMADEKVVFGGKTMIDVKIGLDGKTMTDENVVLDAAGADAIRKLEARIDEHFKSKDDDIMKHAEMIVEIASKTAQRVTERVMEKTVETIAKQIPATLKEQIQTLVNASVLRHTSNEIISLQRRVDSIGDDLAKIKRFMESLDEDGTSADEEYPESSEGD